MSLNISLSLRVQTLPITHIASQPVSLMAAETAFMFWDMFVLNFAVVTVLPFVYRGFRNCLPSGRVRALLSALSELDGLYYHSLESGFMSDFAATALRGQVHA